MEADLYFLSGNFILTINMLFNILRINSHIKHYNDRWDYYQKVIRIIVNEYLPNRTRFSLRPNFDIYLRQQDPRGVNFDPITVETEAENLLVNLLLSI
jgi:hypothetical protein